MGESISIFYTCICVYVCMCGLDVYVGWVVCVVRVRVRDA